MLLLVVITNKPDFRIVIAKETSMTEKNVIKQQAH